MSSTREAFCPKSTALWGTLKGARDTETPLTSTRLNRLAPITFPRERAPCPFTREVMAVTSSGREVPRATKVSAITDSGTPIAWAIRVPLSTSSLAPTAMSIAPITSSTRFTPRDRTFSSPSSGAWGLFFIWDTVVNI